MMKKPVLYFTLLLLMVAGTGCASQGESTILSPSGPLYDTLLQAEIPTVDKLISDSGSIVEVRKTGKVENIVDQQIDLTLTEVKVKKVIKGDPDLVNQNIRIVDLIQTSIGLFDKEDHYLLFLYPKTGRLGEDVYSIVGLYQGKFKVNGNNKVFYDADKHGGIKTFQGELTDRSLTETIEKVKSKEKLLRQ